MNLLLVTVPRSHHSHCQERKSEFLETESNATSARRTTPPSAAADVINLCGEMHQTNVHLSLLPSFWPSNTSRFFSNTNPAALVFYIRSFCFSLYIWISNFGCFASVSFFVLHIHSMKQLIVLKHPTLDNSAINFAFSASHFAAIAQKMTLGTFPCKTFSWNSLLYNSLYDLWK